MRRIIPEPDNKSMVDVNITRVRDVIRFDIRLSVRKIADELQIT